jgi:ssDNA-binding replication factor A large subunit
MYPLLFCSSTLQTVIKIADLQPGRHAVTFYAKVVNSEISEVPRISGEKLTVAEGQLGDETGVINFRVVGDYASKMAKDRVVAVRNARSEVFQEHMRVELDRWGKISEEKVLNKQQPSTLLLF